MELYGYIGSALNIKEFVEGRSFEADLGRIAADAALEALRKVPAAKDGRAQLWSVVNHLELFEASQRKYIRGNLFVKTAMMPLNFLPALNNALQSSALMAACYLYLGEFTLVRGAVDRAREFERDYEEITDSLVVKAGIAASTLNPFAIAHSMLFVRNQERNEPVDLDKVRATLDGLLRLADQAS